MSQPAPTGDGVPILPRLIAELEARDRKGVQTYSTSLRAHNGRDALRDALDEALDLAMYLMQAIAEREAENGDPA